MEIKNRDKSFIENYYNHYIKNLLGSIYKKEWVDPRTLVSIKSPHKNWEALRKVDPYLNEHIKKKEGFYLDILENGMYWSFIGYIENGVYTVTEGVHRLEAVHYLIKNGLWPEGRKVLFMITPKGLFGEAEDLRFSEIKLDPEPTLYVPIYKNPQTCPRLTLLFANDENKKKLFASKIGDILEVQVDNMFKYRQIYVIFPMILKHMFHDYKTKHGDIIKPSPIVNSEEAYYEFLSNRK